MSGTCNSFKVELLRAVHDFTASTGDTFKMALYTDAATLSASTTEYTTVEEVSGAGYVAGGVALASVTPTLSAGVGVADFADAAFGTVTLTYRSALIYNSSKANRAVAFFDFGSSRTVSGGDLTIAMPVPNATNAIIRVT